MNRPSTEELTRLHYNRQSQTPLKITIKKMYQNFIR